MPERIQRKRTKGWCSPDNTVYVGRPTMWGNPFDAKKVGYHNAVAMYRNWVHGWADAEYPDLIDQRKRILANLKQLKGKNLSCWCSEGKPCHADVLLEMANG